MARIIALLLLFAGAPAQGADVALIGTFGNKAAILSLDGGDPKTVKVGQRWNGIRVLSVSGDRATIEVDGERRLLVRGLHYHAGEAASDRQSITLAADARGHFFTEGMVNGRTIRFLVDTGATTVALPASDARRLGVDYRKGDRGFTQTAGGVVPVYRVRLDRVRLGDIELNGIEAVVIERGLEVALLGMTFLNRVEMKREGRTMTLIRRF